MPVPPPPIPTEWTWVYDVVVGQEWPQANEDSLRNCAQAWTDALRQLIAISEGGNAAAQNVGYSVQSISSDQFDKYWKHYTDGDNSAIGQLAQQCEGIASMLLAQAEQVEATKLSIDIQLVILLIQVAYDFAIAPLTGGLSMGEAMVASFVTKGVVRMILARLLESVLMSVAPDFITQEIMLAEGHRSSIDVSQSLESGLVQGVIGSITSPMLQKTLGKGLQNVAGHAVSGLVTAAVDGAVNNVATNLAVYGINKVTDPNNAGNAPTWDSLGKAALSGGVMGVSMHGLHGLRGEPVTARFHDPQGKLLYDAVKTGENTYTLFDPEGRLKGGGTLGSDGSLSLSHANPGDPPVKLGSVSTTEHAVTQHQVFNGDPAKAPTTWLDRPSPGGTITTDRGTIPLPEHGSTLTYDNQGNVRQAVVPDGKQQVYYTLNDQGVFTRTGHTEPGMGGVTHYFDAGGGPVKPGEFQGSVFSHPGPDSLLATQSWQPDHPVTAEPVAASGQHPTDSVPMSTTSTNDIGQTSTAAYREGPLAASASEVRATEVAPATSVTTTGERPNLNAEPQSVVPVGSASHESGWIERGANQQAPRAGSPLKDIVSKPMAAEKVRKFGSVVAAAEDNRNQLLAATYEHEARTFRKPENPREVPYVEYQNGGKASTVYFDAMGRDGTLIDRKLRGTNSSFDYDQLRNQSEALKQLSGRTGVDFSARWEVSDPNIVRKIETFLKNNSHVNNISVEHVPFGVEAPTGPDFAHMSRAELANFHDHWREYPNPNDPNGRSVGVQFGTDKAPDSAGAYLYEWDARQRCGWTDERFNPALPSATAPGKVVRFDAVDLERGLMVDRKLSAPNTLVEAYQQQDALRSAGLEAVWQVPTEAVRQKIQTAFDGAVPPIDKITAEIVRYDRTQLSRNHWAAEHGMPTSSPGHISRSAEPAAEPRRFPEGNERAFLGTTLEYAHQGNWEVRPHLRDILNEHGGDNFAKLEGTENYWKRWRSVWEKIGKEGGLPTILNSDEPPALRLNDILRYTVTLDHERYTNGVLTMLGDLQSRRFRLVTGHDENGVLTTGDIIGPDGRPLSSKYLKSFWKENNRYVGINATLVSPEGVVFEQQFHTPKSWEVKQNLTHELYKVFSADGPVDAAKFTALRDIVAITRREIPELPPGVEVFGEATDTTIEKYLRKQGMTEAQAIAQFLHEVDRQPQPPEGSGGHQVPSRSADDVQQHSPPMDHQVLAGLGLTPVVVPGHPELGNLGYRSPSGLSLHQDANTLAASARIPHHSGAFVVDVHGTSQDVAVGDTRLNPRQLADLIRASGWREGQPVVLFSCETGKGEHPFAAELAAELRSKVIAATDVVYQRNETSPDGTIPTSLAEGDIVIAPRGWNGELGQLDATGSRGRWLEFSPGDGQSRVVASTATGMPEIGSDAASAPPATAQERAAPPPRHPGDPLANAPPAAGEYVPRLAGPNGQPWQEGLVAEFTRLRQGGDPARVRFTATIEGIPHEVSWTPRVDGERLVLDDFTAVPAPGHGDARPLVFPGDAAHAADLLANVNAAAGAPGAGFVDVHVAQPQPEGGSAVHAISSMLFGSAPEPTTASMAASYGDGYQGATRAPAPSRLGSIQSVLAGDHIGANEPTQKLAATEEATQKLQAVGQPHNSVADQPTHKPADPQHVSGNSSHTPGTASGDETTQKLAAVQTQVSAAATVSPSERQFATAWAKEAVEFGARLDAERTRLLDDEAAALKNAQRATDPDLRHSWATVALGMREQRLAQEAAVRDALATAPETPRTRAVRDQLQRAGMATANVDAVVNALKVREQLIAVRDLSQSKRLVANMVDAQKRLQADDARQPLLAQVANRVGDFLGISHGPFRDQLRAAEEAYAQHRRGISQGAQDIAADLPAALAEAERTRQDPTGRLFPEQPNNGGVLPPGSSQHTAQELAQAVRVQDPALWDEASVRYGGPALPAPEKLVEALKERFTAAGYEVTQLPDLLTRKFTVPTLPGGEGERLTQWLTNGASQEFKFGGTRFEVRTPDGGIAQFEARTLEQNRLLGSELDPFLKVTDKTPIKLVDTTLPDGSTLVVSADTVLEHKAVGPSVTAEKRTWLTIEPHVIADPAGEFTGLRTQKVSYRGADEASVLTGSDRQAEQISATLIKKLGPTGLQLDAALVISVERALTEKARSQLSQVRSLQELADVLQQDEKTKLALVGRVGVSLSGASQIRRDASMTIEGTADVVLDGLRRAGDRIGGLFAGPTQPQPAEITGVLLDELPSPVNDGTARATSPPGDQQGSTGGQSGLVQRGVPAQRPELRPPTPSEQDFLRQTAEQVIQRDRFVRPDLLAAADAAGGDMRGLEFFRKSDQSLFEKILKHGGLEAISQNPQSLITELNDTQRYTIVFPDEGYANGVRSVFVNLQEKGYRLFDGFEPDGSTRLKDLVTPEGLPAQGDYFKNFWRTGNRYLGINATLHSPDGAIFEQQFHTERSLAVKQDLTNEMYKVFSADGPVDVGKFNALMEIVAVSARELPALPAGTEIFGDPKNATIDRYLDKQSGGDAAAYARFLLDVDVRPDGVTIKAEPPAPGVSRLAAIADSQQSTLSQRERILSELNPASRPRSSGEASGPATEHVPDRVAEQAPLHDESVAHVPEPPAGVVALEPPPGLESLRGKLFTTPEGLALYDGKDWQMLRAAALAHGDGESFVLDLHGAGGKLFLDGKPLALDAESLVGLLRSAGWQDGQRIIVLSCEAGAGEHSIAEALANAAGAEVLAPNEAIYQDLNGNPPGAVVIAPRGWTGGELGTFDALHGQQGEWRSFKPGEPEPSIVEPRSDGMPRSGRAPDITAHDITAHDDTAHDDSGHHEAPAAQSQHLVSRDGTGQPHHLGAQEPPSELVIAAGASLTAAGGPSRAIAAGGFGTVYEVPSHPDLLVKIATGSEGRPNGQLDREAAHLRVLRDHGIPTVYRGMVQWEVGGQERTGILMERVEPGAFSKAILGSGKFTGQPVEPAERALINSRTVEDLRSLREHCMSSQLNIDDLQFMVAADGSIRLIDPARIQNVAEADMKPREKTESMKAFEKRINKIIRGIQRIAAENAS